MEVIMIWETNKRGDDYIDSKWCLAWDKEHPIKLNEEQFMNLWIQWSISDNPRKWKDENNNYYMVVGTYLELKEST